ncbi:MAG: DUF3011 domain-containing protein [Candidatus Competibacter sp.]|nr:DUF3011 domain-containing protein [Candidatus Competibacter sp.]
MRKPVFSSMAAAVALAAGLSAAPARADTLVCESHDGQTNRCSADTRGGVRLVTQYSKHGCYEGDTWGYDRRGIWVSNGCRAQFRIGDPYSDNSDHDNKHAAAAAVLALGVLGAVALANRHRDDSDYRYEPHPNYSYSGYAPDQVVRCESIGDGEQHCDARIGRGRVEIQRQLSKSTCRFNSTWGYDRKGIWVNQGCRADFAVLR